MDFPCNDSCVLSVWSFDEYDNPIHLEQEIAYKDFKKKYRGRKIYNIVKRHNQEYVVTID